MSSAALRLLIVSLFYLMGCSASKVELNPPFMIRDERPPVIVDWQLPAPAQALASMPVRETSAMILQLLGRDYEIGHNVTIHWNAAVLTPDWINTSSPLTDAAYAIYRLNVLTYSGNSTVRVALNETPQKLENLWIGFSNWEKDRWDWFALPQSGVLVLDGDGYQAYTQPITGDILATIILLGTDIAEVASIEIGVSAQGEWWMYGRDATHSHRSSVVGAQTNQLKWVFEAGDNVRAPAAIGADGVIYCGSFHADGNGPSELYAINPDGSLKWKYPTGDRVNASPAIAVNGTIYYGCNDANLYAMNHDGSLQWIFTAGGAIRSAAIAENGTILFGCSDDAVYALNPDATLKWKYLTGGDTGSPALGSDGTVYIGSFDNNLYAISSNGVLEWVFPDVGSISAPAVGSDGAVYGSSIQPVLYAINTDGTLRWMYPTATFVLSEVALGADDAVYAGGQEFNLYAINPDGTLRWQYLAGERLQKAPAIGADGTVYVGCANGKLYAIGSDGALKWSYSAGDSMNSPAIGWDGTVYVGCDNDKLYAFGP